MTYAVIGSGPCGSIAALLLLQAGQGVVMFDINSEASIQCKEISTTLKLAGGSTAVYDVHQKLTLTHNGQYTNFYRSKLLGGFSNVWGATWGAQESLKSEDWDSHHKDMTKLLNQRGYLREGCNQSCNCFQFIERKIQKLPSGLKISKTTLALNPNICNCVAGGSPSCIHGSVWNSSSLLEQCTLFDNFEFFTDRDVTLIEKNGGRISVTGEGFSETFQHVILAAGTVGTLEVLLNSQIDQTVLTVQDTLMGFIPLFRLGLRKKHSGGFAFSQYSLETRFGKNNLMIHAQLYADAEIYRERILGKVPAFLRALSSPFISLILPHLAIAIIYGDAAMSPKISFSKLNLNRHLNLNYLDPMHSSLGLRRRLWQVFRYLGFFPLLPLLSWSKPGESYHLGAMDGEILDEFGSVKSIPGLHVAGALSLPNITPGPVTHSSMAQTSRLIEKLVTKI